MVTGEAVINDSWEECALRGSALGTVLIPVLLVHPICCAKLLAQKGRDRQGARLGFETLCFILWLCHNAAQASHGSLWCLSFPLHPLPT